MAIPINPTFSGLLSTAQLGINLLSSTVGGDIIGVFDSQSFVQVFINAIPMKLSVNETSRVMDYPVESGATFSDHHIINPTGIELSLLVNADNYSEVYQQIRSAWQNATSLSVQTRTGIYQNIIISDMPHEEDPEMFDAIIIAVRMREVIIVIPSVANQPSNYKPLNPVNASTIARGLQLAKTAVNTVLSANGYINAASLWGIHF